MCVCFPTGNSDTNAVLFGCVVPVFSGLVLVVLSLKLCILKGGVGNKSTFENKLLRWFIIVRIFKHIFY